MRLPYVQLKTTQGCLIENTLSILVFSAAGQSSSCGSTGGRIEARRHERWRVKGSQAGRGVQGGKRDDSIISQNRTIHELSCTLYRRHREVSDVTTVPCLDRTPRNNHIRGARDYSAGRGSRGNWHALPPGPTVPGFAPLQSADVLPHVLHLRFLRFLEGLSFPRSPFARLRAAPEGHWQKPQRSSARRSGHHLAHWNSPGRQA